MNIFEWISLYWQLQHPCWQRFLNYPTGSTWIKKTRMFPNCCTDNLTAKLSIKENHDKKSNSESLESKIYKIITFEKLSDAQQKKYKLL